MDWSLLERASGVIGLFRVEQVQESFRGTLWDFKSLFVEQLTEQDVLKRAKDRNRSFEYDIDTLVGMFREKPREWSYSGDRQLKVKYYVENIPFHFHWDLQENLTGFSEAVAIPLLLALKQTKDREEELLKIVQQKDEEIQDLRRSGGSLVNKFLQTRPLDVRSFNRKTCWDCIGDPGNKDGIVKLIPDFSESGFVPVETSLGDVEENGEAAVVVATGRNKVTKRNLLKRIQSDKIGIKTAEFSYLQGSQETDSSVGEDLEGNLIDEPPPKREKVSTESQKPGAGPSSQSTARSRRRLNDVL